MFRASQLFLSSLLLIVSPVAICETLHDIWIDDQHYRVEIASTPTELARGLMGRDELANDHGMLFVFDSPRDAVFWMKNVRLNLTAYWFNKEHVVVGITHMTTCLNSHCIRYPSPEPVSFVLELARTSKKIKIGGRLRFENPQ